MIDSERAERGGTVQGKGRIVRVIQPGDREVYLYEADREITV
jgi:hypothetical protein